MNDAYEVVHTMTDYWDGPREGIANFQGKPHLYKSEFDDKVDDYSEIYLLMPIDLETFALALEDWKIWLRWNAAYHSCETSMDTHPTLPQDCARHTEIQGLLKGRLEIDPTRTIRATANFLSFYEPSWNGKGCVPLGVRWSVVAGG